MRTYPLRKVYWEMPEFNSAALRGILDTFAVHEATIPDHVYWGGRLYPTLMYSVGREAWFGPMRDVWSKLCPCA